MRAGLVAVIPPQDDLSSAADLESKSPCLERRCVLLHVGCGEPRIHAHANRAVGVFDGQVIRQTNGITELAAEGLLPVHVSSVAAQAG
jgi:hypothetical protein